MIRVMILLGLGSLSCVAWASGDSLHGVAPAAASAPLTDLAKDIVGKESGRRLFQAELQRQLEEAKIKAEIAEANARCREAGGTECGEVAITPRVSTATSSPVLPSPGVFPGMPPIAGMVEQTEEEVLPKVVMVNQDRAIVELPQGRMAVAVGDSIPGGYRVTAISLHEVSVRRDGEKFRLPVKWTNDVSVGESDAE